VNVIPYIHKDFRQEIDEHGYLRHLAEYLASTNDSDTVGALNYVINVLVRKCLKHKGLRYAQINNLIGSLECAKLEIYRTLAAPYEDHKLEKNGDVEV